MTKDSKAFDWNEVRHLVQELEKEHRPGTLSYATRRALLDAKLVNLLVGAIEEHIKASDRLGIRIMILNVIFGVFTVVGAILAFCQLF